MRVTTVTRLTKRCNCLAQNLQSDPDYKVSLADYKFTLRPFNTIWSDACSVSLDTLLGNGLVEDSAAFLVGWLSLVEESK